MKKSKNNISAKINKNGNDKTKTKNKVKKDMIKACVDNAFDLKWPTIEKQVYSNIPKLFKVSLNNLKKKFLKEATQNPLKISKDKYINYLISSFVIVGYNSVMRNLEKNKISCIFADKYTKPDSLTKTFIPICKFKSIPLIPIHELKELLKHSGLVKAMAIGFTNSACEENGPFYELYTTACQALEYTSKLEDSSQSKSKLDSVEVIKNKHRNDASIIVDVESFHLKRTNKSSRVFKPKKRQLASTLNDESFIKIKDPQSMPNVEKKFKPTNLATSATKNEDCYFFIDAAMDSQQQDSIETSEHPKCSMEYEAGISSNEEKNIMPQNSEKSTFPDQGKGIKRKEFTYIPTKIKRIKSKKKTS